jgi:hypothetical protein
MFGRLLDRLRPKRLEDPIFGRLLFIRAKNPARSYWEGEGAFKPLGTDIEYFIAADETGPGETQRELYRLMASNFDRLFATVAPMLQSEYEASTESSSRPDAAPVFRLSSLSIPRKESDDMEWEMNFSCSDSDDWLFTVQMRGWQPTGSIEVMH